jgi:carboxylate-amine ligase
MPIGPVVSACLQRRAPDERPAPQSLQRVRMVVCDASGGDAMTQAADRRQAQRSFGSGPEYTVGVEEELMLLDDTTWELAPVGETVVAEAHDGLHVKTEIRQCMVEIASRPCRTSVELLADLAALRAQVAKAAARQGCRVAGCGTHPFSRPEHQPTTQTPRYLSIMSQVGFPWRRAVVFGTHVHVAVGHADKAIQVTEALLADLPLLIALGSTSPFWQGQDTGLASTRLALLGEVPRTGIPPSFDTFDDYYRALDVLRRSGAVPDASQVWWDVRSQAEFGTIEVRVLDAQPCVRDTAAFAGLIQALVRHHGRRWDGGHRTRADRFVVSENRWQALRHGLDTQLVTPDGRIRPVPALLTRLFERIAGDAEAVDAEWALARLARRTADGGVCPVMRRRYRQVNDLREVTRWVAELGRHPGDQPACGAEERLSAGPSQRCGLTGGEEAGRVEQGGPS